MTHRANADIERLYPALGKVTGGVLVIAGIDSWYFTNLSTVSRYNIASDTWEGLNPKLNIARYSHSVCVLKGMIYVFCGIDYTHSFLNSIEVISETSLVQKSIETWQIFNMKSLAPCYLNVVAPINHTEIAICGGLGNYGYLSEVIVFNTTTKQCEKVANGGDYKFVTLINQCA